MHVGTQREREPRFILHEGVSDLTDIDLTHFAVALHAASDVQVVGPDVVAEFPEANDASHHRPGVDTAADL